jgi:hypothetical protein
MGSYDATHGRLYGKVSDPRPWVAWQVHRGQMQAVASGGNRRELISLWPRARVLRRGVVPAGARLPDAAGCVSRQAGGATAPPAESTRGGRR